MGIRLSKDERLASITLDLESNWGHADSCLRYEALAYTQQYTKMIAHLGIPVSIFAVGQLIEECPHEVEYISDSIECDFHLHTYYHSLQTEYTIEEEIERGLEAFETYFGYVPDGYRAAMGKIQHGDLCTLDNYGFLFDSSIFPTYRPGLFNYLQAPTQPFHPEGCEKLLEIPFAVTPWVRIPIAQSYLKLLGIPYLEALKRIPLNNILVIDSHIQDFHYLMIHDKLKQPLKFIHKRNIRESPGLFEELIDHLRERGYKFVTMSELYKRITA